MVVFADEPFVAVEVVDGGTGVAVGIIGALFDAPAQGVVAVGGQEPVCRVFDGLEAPLGVVFVAFVSWRRAILDLDQAAVGVVLVGFCSGFEQSVVRGVFPGGGAGFLVAEAVADGVVAVPVLAGVGIVGLG